MMLDMVVVYQLDIGRIALVNFIVFRQRQHELSQCNKL